MGKVIFSVQYEIIPQKKIEYYSSIKELKSLISAEGLIEYSVFEVKGKPNHFGEMFVFNSMAAYENYEDGENERVNILLSKVESLKVHGSTKYLTLNELVFQPVEI